MDLNFHLLESLETIGPRSNNHVEGHNFTLNNDIDSVHPNIFRLVGTLKEHEVLNSMSYIRLIHGVLAKTSTIEDQRMLNEMRFSLI